MISLQHSRSRSSDTLPTGSSDGHIFTHIPPCNASREIPLRALYTLNSTPRAQPVPNRHGTRMRDTSSSPSNPVRSQRRQDILAAQAFHNQLSLHISHLPSHPSSIPPSFITSFLGRCFPPDLVCVDFPRALTGLDYLKELEIRRQKQVADVLSRTEMDQAVLDHKIQLHQQHSSVSRWARNVKDEESIIQSLYAQLYIVLRRWILVNELSLMPFNKQNCVAMLNTLFPPIASVSPTANPTQDTLQEQRDDFFKKISSVEKSGPQVLSSIHQQGMTEGDANGWAPVARQLGMYLQLTTSMMDECCNMQNVERLVPHKHVFGKGGNSKTDTNVSLSGFDKWPSTSGTGVTFPTEPCRPKTSSGARGTQLGKLARGLETFGRSRTKVADLSPEDEMFAIPHQKQHKAVKKIRSIGKLSLKF